MTTAPQPQSVAQRLVSRAAAVPPPATMIGPLMRMIDDERTDLRQIGRFVAADPVMAADALRVANSAAFATLTGPIDDCVLAVVRLGESIICSLVAARLRGMLGRPSLPGYDMQRGGLWQHSLRVAIAARLLAKESGAARPAVAYTAGLLVDIGKILMADSVADRWHDLMAVCGESDEVTFDQAERQIFGIDHAALGGIVTRTWNIPEPVPSAIATSHWPRSAPAHARPLACIIHVADALVTQLGVGGGADGLRYDVDEEALALLTDDPLRLQLLAAATESEFKRMESALSEAGQERPRGVE